MRRVGRPQAGQRSMTFEAESGAACDRMPLGLPAPGFKCLVCRLTFSTMSFPTRGKTLTTRPCFPRSPPRITLTLSPVLIPISLLLLSLLPSVPCSISVSTFRGHPWSHDFRGHRDELARGLTELAGDGSENPTRYWLSALRDQDRSVIIKPHPCAVSPSERFPLPDQ